jgi:hypothetical protein
MTCPAGCFHGHAGYDRRGRVIACRKCAGTGVIGPAEPQRLSPGRTVTTGTVPPGWTFWLDASTGQTSMVPDPRPFAALIP